MEYAVKPFSSSSWNMLVCPVLLHPRLLRQVLTAVIVAAAVACISAAARDIPAHEQLRHFHPQHPAAAGFRVDLTHIDSLLMDAQTLRSPERLKRAADSSVLRSQMIARRRLMKQQRSSSRIAGGAVDQEDSDAPVYSSASGSYIVKLALGTPPQDFVAILDTGSDLVWRQSAPCDSCFQQSDPYFDPSSSSTYKTVSCTASMCSALPQPTCGSNQTCEYSYSYGDGSSTSGGLSSDTLTIGGLTAQGFVFGAGEDNSGTFTACDGLVGMGGGPLSLPSQMATTIGSKFAYCLVTWTDATSKTSALLFGAHADLTGGDVKTTPFTQVSSSEAATFYYITLHGISVGGQLLDIPEGTFDIQPDGSGGFIIDSGTTITMLVDDAYKPLRAAYASAINLPTQDGSSVGLDLCFDNLQSTKIKIPSLTLHLEGADIDLPAENIFVDYQGYFCLAFLGLGSTDITTNIFGNVQQQNFQIMYDKTSNNQLSFKPITCDTL